MSAAITRRALAIYVVSQMTSGVPTEQVIQQLAAYLIESGRVREADLVVRSIEDELAVRGIVIARVVTAEPLNDALKGLITKQLAAKTVHLNETIDQSMIGGIRIETADRLFDGTIKRKLLTLRHAKL